MDHRDIDIEAHIRAANELRSKEMGRLIVAGWRGFTRLLAACAGRAGKAQVLARNPVAPVVAPEFPRAGALS